MLRLALDTSTSPGSVGLAEGEALLAETLLPVRAARSETVVPEVRRLLAACGRRPEEVAALVVGAGPGSFTGVRIAAGLAKGFRFGRDVPLFAYSSLLAVAAGSGLEGGVCALFDARRGEVYAAAYRRVAPGGEVFGPAALPVEALLEELGAIDPGRAPGDGSGRAAAATWAFAGEGALLHRERITARGGRVLPAHLAPPRASALLWLAREWPEEGRIADPGAWEPAYVRRSGADRAAMRAAGAEPAGGRAAEADRAARPTSGTGPG